jgi:hypothetical protein
MNINKSLTCPKCAGKSFEVKREATYIYTYKVNTPNLENLSANKEGLPFLFDNREKSASNEYLICLDCGAEYQCSLEEDGDKVNLTILQKAIRADNQENPQFLG